MAVLVRCPNPNCLKTASVPEEKLGHTARCGSCGVKFVLEPIQAAPESIELKMDEAQPARASGHTQVITDSKRKVVSRYILRNELGSGAFGTVYAAYDPQLDREIALKILRPEAMQSPKAVERFQREAKAAARMLHPNIVPVYDAGQDQGLYFIASAFIQGQVLSHLIPENGLDPRQAVQWAIQLLDALHYAHRQGILHRDVKPVNIMVDESGNLFLMDFGLAGWMADTARITTDGTIMGTPTYMPPEQAKGETQGFGATSDLYSAGVVLFQMLTGQVPFEGPPPVVIYHVIHSPAPLPSSLRPDLDPPLEAICLKAMAKEPSQRFQSANDFAQQLRTWLVQQPPLSSVLVKGTMPIQDAQTPTLKTEESSRSTSTRSAPDMPPLAKPHEPPAKPPPSWKKPAEQRADQEKPSGPSPKAKRWIVLSFFAIGLLGGGAALWLWPKPDPMSFPTTASMASSPLVATTAATATTPSPTLIALSELSGQVSKHLEAKEYDQALKLCQQLSQAHKDSAIPWKEMTRVHRAQGMDGMADAALAEALKLAPDDPDLRVSRAERMLAIGLKEVALADLDHALTSQPRHLGALKLRTQLHRAMGDHAKAMQDIEQWLQADPKAGQAYFERAQLRPRNQFNAILADLDQAMKWAPSAEAAYQRAALLNLIAHHLQDEADAKAQKIDLRKYEDAIVADATEAMKLGMDRDDLRRLRAVTLFQQQKFDAALEDFSKLTLKEPRRTDLWHLASCHSRLGVEMMRSGKDPKAMQTHFQSAVKLFEDLHAKYPWHLPYAIDLGANYFFLGEWHEKQQQLAEAKTAFEKASKCGYARASQRLSDWYLKAIHVAMNFEESGRWKDLARKQIVHRYRIACPLKDQSAVRFFDVLVTTPAPGKSVTDDEAKRLLEDEGAVLPVAVREFLQRRARMAVEYQGYVTDFLEGLEELIQQLNQETLKSAGPPLAPAPIPS